MRSSLTLLMATASAGALIVALPGVARAGIADNIGLGPRAAALAGAMVARSGDSAALHHNPAGLLATSDQPGFVDASVGIVWATPRLYVDALDGGAGPETIPVDDTRGLLLGLRLDPGVRLGVTGLALGLSVYAPTHLFAWKIHPDDDPQWLFHSDRTQHIAVRGALAWQLGGGLTVGAGIRAMFDTQTNTRARVTDVRRSPDAGPGDAGIEVSTKMGEDVTVFGKVAPIVGVRWEGLGGDLSLGATWRGELFVDDWGRTRIVGAPGLGDAGYAHRFSHYYEPMEVAVGVAWRPSPWLHVSTDVTWGRWSKGLTTNHQALGPGRYGDTVLIAAGASADVGAATMMAGYRWQPSPFDNFGGPTNLLDNDRHVLAAGAEVPLTGRLRLVAAAVAQILVEREEIKDWRRFESDAQMQDNPGSAGYRHGGVVVASTLAIEASW